VVLSKELCILSSCFLSPMNKNSVLEELRVSRLAVIQEEICAQTLKRTSQKQSWCVSRGFLHGKQSESTEGRSKPSFGWRPTSGEFGDGKCMFIK